MAVTQSSGANSESSVERVESSCREVADAGPCELHQLSESNVDLGRCDKGASTGQLEIKQDTSRVVKRKRNRTKSDVSDSLSDIDDAEVIGYLNTKEETCFKRILWESMNGEYVKAKKQKRATETKKGVSLKKSASIKKAATTTEKVELPKRSSRINYDALKALSDELEQDTDAA